MIVFLALLAAFVYGGGVVLQQKAAVELPPADAAKPRLLVRLMRRPIWLAGMGADVVGFAIQAAALRRGSLVIVQPLITTSLLFTLVLGSAWTHVAIPRREWAAVVLVLVGLSLFLLASSPDVEGPAGADARGWILCTVSVAAVAILVVGAGLRSTGAGRAALFAVGAGVADAFMAVLAKEFAGSFNHGLIAVLHTWTPYALIVAGAIAVLLISTAYQAGHPTVSLPIITVVDPLVGCLIGMTLFHETLVLHGLRGAIVAVSLVAMAAGLLVLSRSSDLAREVAGESRSSEAR